MPEHRPMTLPQRRLRPSRGLRARLWFAVLGGALASAIVTGCLIAAVAMAGTPVDPSLITAGLAASIVLGVIAALICGRWLVWGVANSLREIDAGLASGLPLDPGRRDWGEIASVADRARELSDTRRDLRRSQAELDSVYEAMLRARDGVERWIATERWEPLLPSAGSLAPLAESLDRGFQRAMGVVDQNAEAARLVRDELIRVVEESRASAEMTEHGYVEATALMTTVREIGRLASEIQQATLEPPRNADTPAELPAWRDEAVKAIEELVDVSGQSVEYLGAGLVKVHEIAAQVQLLSNRATLIALNAVVASGRGEARPALGENTTAEMKQLARDVRVVTDRVATLSSEVSQSVQTASERMRVVREHVSERLERLPTAPPPVAPAMPAAPIGHWLERLREMVQDAARKGERLSESQERVSSDVQRLTRRLEDEARDLEGLLVRLTPAGQSLQFPTSRGLTPAVQRLRVLDTTAAVDEADDASRGGEIRP